jgi:hypothetical protein
LEQGAAQSDGFLRRKPCCEHHVGIDFTGFRQRVQARHVVLIAKEDAKPPRLRRMLCEPGTKHLVSVIT